MSLDGGKWVSIQQIVWELYRDTGIQEEIPFSDVIEWTVDVLNLLGYPDQYKKVVTGYREYPDWDFDNYRIELPCDFHKLNQVAVDGYPAIPSANTFHHLLSGDCCGLDELGETDGSTFTDIFGNTFDTTLGVKSQAQPVTFDINNNFITFSVESGKVCMSYFAFPTDKEGFPMIPDKASYKEAVKKYSTVKLDYIKWRRNPDSRGLREVYEESKKDYYWYIGKAAADYKVPDLGRMEAIRSQLLRLRPRVNEYDKFFKGLNFAEHKRIH